MHVLHVDRVCRSFARSGPQRAERPAHCHSIGAKGLGRRSREGTQVTYQVSSAAPSPEPGEGRAPTSCVSQCLTQGPPFSQLSPPSLLAPDPRATSAAHHHRYRATLRGQHVGQGAACRWHCAPAQAMLAAAKPRPRHDLRLLCYQPPPLAWVGASPLAAPWA